MKADLNREVSKWRLPYKRRCGFTLIELLVVIAIIGMLAAMLMPAIGSVRRSAKRRKAAAEAKSLVHAVKLYHNVYGKWPGQVQGASDNVVPHFDIIAALTNNPRKKIFIEIPANFLVGGKYLDPWRRPYVIVMDENADGTTMMSTALFTTNIGNETALVMSWGSNSSAVMRVYSWK